MFSKLKIKFGSSPGQADLEIDPTKLTIFIGPNNSGKSLILRELLQFCGGESYNSFKIIKEVILQDYNYEEEILRFVVSQDEDPDNPIHENNIRVKNFRGATSDFDRQHFNSILGNAAGNFQQFCIYFLSWMIYSLDGTSRLQMTDNQAISNLKAPTTLFGILFIDDNKRREVRRILYAAFKKFFVLDPTSGGSLQIRFSDTEPEAGLERSLSDENIEFNRRAQPIQSMSDGVKAFVGIVVNLITDESKAVLIDEPEAFLHPSLSFMLGKEIGNILNGNDNKKAFVATHSANFLMGNVQSGIPTNIVRLTYSNNIPTARLLHHDRISELMRNPLLRSIGALTGLFYEFVVITEADSDRAFYQEINERLLQFDSTRGIQNCLFLNAQNWQTIHQIMKPLREMGIPCAAIVDVDVVKVGGQDWGSLMDGAFLPQVTRQGTETQRSRLKEKFDLKGGDFKRNGGLGFLDDQLDQQAGHDLFNNLGEYGIFVVREGELEDWLSTLEIPKGHKSKWLVEMFEKMGSDPTSNDYVRPADGDVWDFIASLKTWFANPVKRGIPN